MTGLLTPHTSVARGCNTTYGVYTANVQLSPDHVLCVPPPSYNAFVVVVHAHCALLKTDPVPTSCDSLGNPLQGSRATKGDEFFTGFLQPNRPLREGNNKDVFGVCFFEMVECYVTHSQVRAVLGQKAFPSERSQHLLVLVVTWASVCNGQRDLNCRFLIGPNF